MEKKYQDPIVVNLGKKSRKKIKQLKRGEGKMAVEVQLAMDEVRARLPEADKGKQLVPIVMFCERRARRVKGLKGLSLPMSPMNMFK